MPKEKDKPKLCFVIGPIGEESSDNRIHSDWLLEEIIRPVMEKFPNFEVRRADEIAAPGLIDSQVFVALFDAELVIADLSTLNPNVFYEIGIRHMAQKPIVHMHMKGSEKIPFDVSLYRSTEFSRATPRDLRVSRERLTAVVKAVLEPDYEVENPVTKARGKVQLRQTATPDQIVLLDQLEAIQSRLGRLEATASRIEGDDVLELIIHLNEDTTDLKGTLDHARKVIAEFGLEALATSAGIDELRFEFAGPPDFEAVRQVGRRLITELGAHVTAQRKMRGRKLVPPLV